MPSLFFEYFFRFKDMAMDEDFVCFRFWSTFPNFSTLVYTCKMDIIYAHTEMITIMLSLYREEIVIPINFGGRAPKLIFVKNCFRTFLIFAVMRAA